jgi:hypothetical protein
MSSRDPATRALNASSQDIDTKRSPRLISGWVSRSGLSLAIHPCNPFGPKRPLFTRSIARPRIPTMRPSLTPMSRAHPVEQSTHVDCTQRSGCSRSRSSTRTGQMPLWGVRVPHRSLILSRVSFMPCREIATQPGRARLMPVHEKHCIIH